jgi:hypothetical protein
MRVKTRQIICKFQKKAMLKNQNLADEAFFDFLRFFLNTCCFEVATLPAGYDLFISR